MSSGSRIPIIDKDKCKPTKCNFECGIVCPPNQQLKKCIELVDIEDMDKPKRTSKINESLCIGCGMCAGKLGCPFGAIQMVNIPKELGEPVHRYGTNGFRLYNVPIMKPNHVTGVLSENGMGKTSIVGILSNKIKLTTTGLDYFKGTEMHKYMTLLYENKLSVVVKPQHVDHLIPVIKKKNENITVKEYINSKVVDTEDSWCQNVITNLDIASLYYSKVVTLSGGELQRLICAICRRSCR